MKLKSIKEIKNLKNKRILVRCDFDVPLNNKRGQPRIANNFKIKANLPTIKYLQNKGAIVVLISHLGRPCRGGLRSAQNKKLSLFPVARYLSQKLKDEIIFVDDSPDPELVQRIKKLKPGQIVLLENLRFYPSEEKNSPILAKKLARLGDIYVNEAFANSHREHASMNEITKYLPTYAGLNLEREVQELNQILEHSKHPSLAIIGGKKIETKIPVIENLAKKFDLILVGGATANNFIKAIGYEVGKSVIEKEYLKQALELLNTKKINQKLIIPCDVRVGTGLESPRKSISKPLDEVEKDEYILDIGPRTQRLYSGLARRARTIIWNGPMGLYENKHFYKGSYALARSIALTRGRSVIGGGETIDIVKRLHLTHGFSFISTGGGAMLEFLEGKTLPGIKPLIKK